MIATAFGGPGPVFLLLLALAIDAAAGDWLGRVLPDPAGLSARLCAVLDRRLNRPDRGAATRLVRGVLVVLVLLVLGGVLGVVVEWVSGTADSGWLLELATLLAVLRGRRAWVRARAVRRALEGPGLAAAREAVGPLTRRPAHALDAHAIARAAIEHAATGFNRKVVAPAFWYLLLGVPGLLVWAVVDGAGQALGDSGMHHERFGLTAARMDDALNALPARLAGVLLALGSPFVATASLSGAAAALRTDAGKHPSLNTGWPLAAVAGGLGLALAGPFRDGGVTVSEPWIGDGRARVGPADIGRALALTALADLLLMLLVGLLMVAMQGA